MSLHGDPQPLIPTNEPQRVGEPQGGYREIYHELMPLLNQEARRC